MQEQENSLTMLDVTVERFAPMRRLLSGEDEEYLIRRGFRREAALLRARHRRLYFRFVNMLERDFNRVHDARKACMIGNWDFETLLKEKYTAASCLWLMRLAGVLHWLHLPQASEVAETYVTRMEPYFTPTANAPERTESTL